MANQLDVALQNLMAALRLAPNNPDAHLDLGKFYYYQGQINLAIPFFEKTIRLDPGGWEAHYFLANALIRKDMVLQAIDHYKAALQINLDHANTKLNLAMALVSTKDYASALPFLIEAAALDPNNAELQGHLAECFLDLGKTPAAIEQFKVALALDPKRAIWHYNIAVLYMREQQKDLARQHFELCLELEPQSATVQYLLEALKNDTANPAVKNAPANYVSDLFDQYSSYYNVHMRKKLKYDVPALLRNAISKYVGPTTTQQNILDLGCGTGLCGVYFRDLAGFLIGVDISAGMLAQAKELGAYDGLCRCDILQVVPGYNRHVFNIVLAADVFVYIGDLEQIFNVIKGVLRDKGMFAFTVELLLDSADAYKLQATGRFAHSRKYIEDLAQDVGFVVQTADAVNVREHLGEPIAGMLFVLSSRPST